MADFQTAQQKLSFAERGYANYSKDRGGETYAGISRRFWPGWEGWRIIDSLKKEKSFPKNLTKDPHLGRLVEEFYEEVFWFGMKLHRVNSQIIAENLYLFGVNAGKRQAIRLAQRVLGLKEDGIIGAETIKALNEISEETFKSAFDEAERAFYESLVQKDPSQSIFLEGWKNRVLLAQNDDEGMEGIA